MEAWAGRPIAFKPATFYLEIVSLGLTISIVNSVTRSNELLLAANRRIIWRSKGSEVSEQIRILTNEAIIPLNHGLKALPYVLTIWIDV